MALIDLVQEYHNVLDSDTCNQIIERFDNDKRKYEGFVIGEDEGNQVKRSTDLSISSLCLLYTSPSPRDYAASRMPSSA